MNNDFKRIIEQMPVLMERLMNTELQPWGKLGKLPESGIYAFYENGEPLYVGRSNRMRDRLKEHGRQGSPNNSAPFAFNIAKQDAERTGIDIARTRTDLEHDNKFNKLFRLAKKRVSQMSIRVVEVDDPILQTIFEVYAAMELKTPFNDFDTH